MINLDILEPITYENITELKGGDWIWDNKTIERRAHKYGLGDDVVMEPIGFRKLHLIDLKWSNQMMLSSFDKLRSGYFWEYFELGRFYRFRKGDISNE